MLLTPVLPYAVGHPAIAFRSQSVLQSWRGQTTEQHNESETMTVPPSFYHTEAQFNSRLAEMAKACKNTMTLDTIDATLGIPLAIIKENDGGKSQGEKKVAMLLFGEHAREIISSETALEVIADLCLLNKAGTDQAKASGPLIMTNHTT